MLEAERALALARRVVERSRVDDTEIRIESRRESSLHFAANAAAQAGDRSSMRLRVRARVGRREGVASTDAVDERSLAHVVERAAWAARAAAESVEAPAWADAQRILPRPCFAADTAEHSITAKATAIAMVIARCRAAGLAASGAFRTEAWSATHASSRGVAAHQTCTRAMISVHAQGGDGTGFRERVHFDAARLDALAVAEDAVRRAEAARAPAGQARDRATLWLEPSAAAAWLDVLASAGLAAPPRAGVRSFLAEHLGKAVAASLLSLGDDVHHPSQIGEPFDDEGSPRRRVALIEGGVAKSVVHDRATAARAGLASTGHRTPGGPAPMHLVLEPGADPAERVRRGLRDAILVSRLKASATFDSAGAHCIVGSTVGGALALSSGDVAASLRDVRFSMPLEDCLRRVAAVAAEAELVASARGASSVVPAIVLDDVPLRIGADV